MIKALSSLENPPAVEIRRVTGGGGRWYRDARGHSHGHRRYARYRYVRQLFTSSASSALPCHVWVAHHGSLLPPQSLRTGVWKSPSLVVAAPHRLTDTPVQGRPERLGRPPESSPQIDCPEPIERLPGRPAQAAPRREARAAVASASQTEGGAFL